MDEGQESRSAGAPEPLQEGLSARWVRIWASRQLLMRVARRGGASAEDAEDAVQEAMLRAAEHPEIAEDRLQAWLCAVTMRLCMDGHRRRAAEARRWERASGQAVVQQPGQYFEEEVCERSEAAWMAALAPELLPPRQIQALWLIAEGCTIQQVASHLGVRHSAAESVLARARRTLRTVLIASLSAGVETPCTGASSASISYLAPTRQRAACPAPHDLPATAINTTTATMNTPATTGAAGGDIAAVSVLPTLPWVPVRTETIKMGTACATTRGIEAAVRGRAHGGRVGGAGAPGRGEAQIAQ